VRCDERQGRDKEEIRRDKEETRRDKEETRRDKEETRRDKEETRRDKEETRILGGKRKRLEKMKFIVHEERGIYMCRIAW
jgi:hypothetical protein